jgi:bleomycin hydrolase
MKKTSLLFACLLGAFCAQAQYKFKKAEQVESTKIKNQCNTGTCWSFATTSFIESELMRMGHGDIDLSEMFVVRNVYQDKAENYLLRQGRANFSQGSLSHDMIRVMGQNGVVPEGEYSGLLAGEEKHDHSEMERGLKGFMDGVMKSKRPTQKWKAAFSGILDSYMGESPETFEVDGKKFNPQSYAESLGLVADDYVSLTSFSHHSFGEEFVLEIPDNYSNGQFMNVELDKMMETIDNAMAKGYSIAWDGDVSERGFSDKKGIAVLAKDPKRDDIFTEPGEETIVTQENRQEAFENYSTTDDHLMHMIGTTTDQNGTKYYIIKNSWGQNSPHDGLIYMSESYVKMKTVAIMLHKEALPVSLSVGMR